MSGKRMTKVTHIDGLHHAREQAAEWIVRVDNDELIPSEVDALKQWLSQDPLNQRAFAELAQVWGGMDSLSELAELIPLDSAMVDTEPDDTRVYPWRSVVAFSFVLFFAVAIAVIYPDWKAQQFRHAQVATTLVGEQETLALPDGSSLVLNTDSNVNIQFDEHRRNIYLNRGEAHFDVAHDPDRPFIVHAGQGRVTAVGTAFNVHYHQGSVDVIVTDGVVEVETLRASIPEEPAPAVPKSEPILSRKVTAGQSVSFDTVIHEVDKVPEPEVDRRLSWRKGMLSFSGEPLQQVIAEVSRYTETRIVIQDPVVAELPMGGYFKAGETEAMLEVLQVSFGLQVTRVSDKVIVLSQGDDFKPE